MYLCNMLQLIGLASVINLFYKNAFYFIYLFTFFFHFFFCGVGWDDVEEAIVSRCMVS